MITVQQIKACFKSELSADFDFESSWNEQNVGLDRSEITYSTIDEMINIETSGAMCDGVGYRLAQRASDDFLFPEKNGHKREQINQEHVDNCVAELKEKQNPDFSDIEKFVRSISGFGKNIAIRVV